MMATRRPRMVNTVRGPISTAELGFTLSHEHVVVTSAGIPHVFPEAVNRDEAIAQGAEELGTAHAAGLTDVILPERNRPDLDDVPEDVREQMTFHPVMTIGEVHEHALEPAPVAAAA